MVSTASTCCLSTSLARCDNFDLDSSHVIPAMIRKMIAAREEQAATVTLWGDGSPTREFLYSEDCARGIVRAADVYDGPEPINLGSGSEISMRELAELIARLVGFAGEIVWDTARPNGQPRRCLDVSRAAQLLQWRAEIPFEEGLRRTIAWWEANQLALVR